MKPGLFRIRILNTIAEIECAYVFNDLFRDRPGAFMDHDTNRWIITADVVDDTRTWLETQGHTVVVIRAPKPPPTPTNIREHEPPPEPIPADWYAERVALLDDIRARALAGEPRNPDRDENRMRALIANQHQRPTQ